MIRFLPSHDAPNPTRLLTRFSLMLVACVIALLMGSSHVQATAADDLTLLFMGDNGHHQPSRRFQDLAPVLAKRGIELKYTDDMSSLNADTLSRYDGLVLYANIDRIDDDQADALLDYVAQGHGFVPLHCATFCWRNNPKIVALMGGQFQRHGARVFTTEIAEPDHPIMSGYGSFTSWDETYIHHLHNEENRTVLEYRSEGVQAEGQTREPWTWIRTHGKGRVFYTAWGHDQRTFSQGGFHNLVERGIRWACGADPSVVPAFTDPSQFSTPAMTELAEDLPEFEFVDVGPKIPNYTVGANWGSQGKPKNLMQKPLSVEESMKHFVTPKGMAVRRYADERDFQSKPIAMNWDERGRLWVCETLDYPNELGGDRDRIRICEDTDGDHIADKFTVFAEGLSIPTAIVIHRGGAVVQNGTETIYLKDTDGDDVADERTTLISGWSLGDTHGGVSNFRYGLDNWIWAMQGYNNSTPRYDGKRAQTFRQGFWRFKLSQDDRPKVTDLEFIRSSDNNTWGLGISEDGLIFGSTANRNPSMFVPIPNRYYERVRGWAPSTLHSIADTHKFEPITDKVRQVDQFGGYTAGAGHALYTARTFPTQWWNKTAFVCGPTGHLVGTFVLRREGANYTSTSPTNLLASDDEWSAPIMAEVGPDGAVWVIDWYNYIVQHNPTPHGFETGKGAAYESDLRDKRRGRIYRVVPVAVSGDKLHEFTSLAGASNGDLVETLKHPSFMWRLHAQRLLIERKAEDVLAPLVALVTDSSVDAIGLNVGAIHALHTLKGLGYLQLDKQFLAAGQVRSCLETALNHPSAGVRRNALSVLPGDRQGLELLLDHSALFRDSDQQVTLQAMLTLADMPVSEDAGKRVAQLASEFGDRTLIDAVTSAAAAHALPFLNALTATTVEGKSAPQQIARRVAEHVARGRPDAEGLKAILVGLSTASPSLANEVIEGLASGLPRDIEIESNEGLNSAFVGLFKKLEGPVRVKVLRLASQCGNTALDDYATEVITDLKETLADLDATGQTRANAARDLIAFRTRDDEAVEEILEQIGAQTAPQLSKAFLDAIRLSQSQTAGEQIAEALVSWTPTLKSSALDVLISRPSWVGTMIESIEEGELDLNDLSLQQKQALQSFPNPAIRSRAEKLLARGGGLPDKNREKVLQSLMHLTEVSGDVENGRVAFKKACAACHKHGDMGKEIGPNLTGMAVHPKEELLTHILDPSRNVEGNFRLYNVLTADGTVISGMLSSETRTSLTMIDSTGKEIQLAREDIEELIASRKSVMPEGFEKQLNEQELTDLLEFLTNKGRFIPISLDRYATAISTKGLFTDNDNGADRMIFADWKPRVFKDVPFVLTDPRGKSTPNIILLNGPFGPLPPKMPKSVSLPCNTTAKAVHLLSGVGGWNHPFDRKKTVSMIVRLKYADGETEDHPLVNGVHFADYIRRVDVPESEFAFSLRGQQIRYLSVEPKRTKRIETIELVKGEDISAPIVMAVTVER